MAKQEADCITLDLFAHVARVGRPRTNPLSREQQIRINKRNQLRSDKAVGLRRVELKLHSSMVEQLEELAEEANLSRQQLIEQILQTYLEKNRN